LNTVLPNSSLSGILDCDLTVFADIIKGRTKMRSHWIKVVTKSNECSCKRQKRTPKTHRGGPGIDRGRDGGSAVTNSGT
jgi:hypothetical protein